MFENKNRFEYCTNEVVFTSQKLNNSCYTYSLGLKWNLFFTVFNTTRTAVGFYLLLVYFCGYACVCT